MKLISLKVTSTTWGRVPVDLVSMATLLVGRSVVLSTADVGEVCSVMDCMATGI